MAEMTQSERIYALEERVVNLFERSNVQREKIEKLEELVKTLKFEISELERIGKQLSEYEIRNTPLR
jgi:hypothetical protein